MPRRTGRPRPATDLLLRLGVRQSTLPALLGSAGLAGLDRVGRSRQRRRDRGRGITRRRRSCWLQCLVTPGHSSGHLSLWDPESRVLFSEDHLLVRIVPVPSLVWVRGETDDCDRGRTVVDYLQGLPRFVGLDPAVVLPGHGVPSPAWKCSPTACERTAASAPMTTREMLANGPATPYEVTCRLLWRPDGPRLLAGIAHVLGHLDLLEAPGRVVAGTEEVVSYRLAS
jgi:glyoxylase-like metal-dependent hydrolase (beta-lactamase superfamily II)